MANKERYGDGDDYIAIPAAVQTISGTTPIVSNVIDMRRYDSVAFQLITTLTVAGSWKVEVSNNYVAAGVSVYGQIATAGDWTDITSQFSPTIATVVSGGSSQYVQADLTARSIRVTFTPTSGAGVARANVTAKSWS